MAAVVAGAALGALAACNPSEAGPASAPGRETLELTLENINTPQNGPSSVSLSPDGRWMAVVASVEGRHGIYLMSADSADGALHWWREGGSPVWSPNSNRIAFTAEGDLWVAARTAGGSALRLTQKLPGVRDQAFSPDGESIAFYATPDSAQDIWLVRSDGGAPPKRLVSAVAEPDDPRFEPAWSPDGRRIAYVSDKTDYWSDDVWLVDVASGRTSQLTRKLMASSTPVWSPGGDKIALFGTAKNEYWYQDLAYIYLVNPASPGSERPIEMQVWATDAIMRNRPFWSGDGRTIYFPYMERGNDALWAVPDTGGVATQVTSLGGSIRSLSASAGASEFAFVRGGPADGAEVYRIAAAGGPSVRLTDLSPVWKGVQEPRELAFRSFDGMYIQGFLFLPPQAAQGGRCPALVNVHGGGTNSYMQRLDLMEQYLASRGFVVLAINYRGGSGFGRSFQDLAVGDWMGGQALDAGAAADFLRGLPYVNGKVGIFGGSYGGSTSLAAATRTPDKFDAVVAMRGAYSESKSFDEIDRLGKIFTKTGHGALPDENPAAYRVSNTIERLDRLQAPLLLMHGEADRRVPFTNYKVAVAELQRLGKQFESHSYPGEGHGFRKPENRIDMDRRLETFFQQHLGSCSR
jgi:dipeptidyl aminopeptidase/acylaminoacyl peptidase